MSYLMIENPGVAPLEGFTVLGPSSARNNAESIGQFGSGNKHAVLLLLREGLIPVIYLGKQKLVFTTKPARMGETHYNRVLYSLGGATPKDMGACLEYGELDWDDVGMAVREFVSNALDAVGGDFSKINISLVENTRAKDGTTRIFVPASPEVVKFFTKLSEKFLHTIGKENSLLIENETPKIGRIYRKGVFVRVLKDKSLFDYNFGEDLPIDEARNLDDYRVQSMACRYITKDKTSLKRVFRSLVTDRNQGIWEHKFSKYYLESNASLRNKEWKEAWKETYGDSIVATPTQASIVERAIRKGHKVVLIDEDSWYQALVSAGVSSAIKTCDDINDRGHEIVPITSVLQETFDFCWAALELLGVTKNHNKPNLTMFRQIVEGEEHLAGYYDRKTRTVCINQDNQTSKITVLEELAHYLSGASDMTRDFQSFVIAIAARAIEAMV